MKVLIACGGTGGHLFPGLAVAETLLDRRHQVTLLVSEKAVDSTALAALTNSSGRSGFAVHSVSATGYGGARQLIGFCGRLARAVSDCANLCRRFEPDAVLGMGGFTSAPAVLAARWQRGVATLIHESNAVPGKANRLAGRLADHIAVGLSECARHFGGKRVTVTGTPIRRALRRGKVADALKRLDLQSGRQTILVMGGSQGAHAVNETVAAALPWLEDWKERTQFVHLSGPRDETFVREAYEGNGFAAKVMSFCNEMELAYSAADLVVARSGAATLTELAAFGLPSILIPYEHAAGNHQLHNARVFERAGAAVVVEQTPGLHVTAGERLADKIAGLLADEKKRDGMASAARSLAVDNAAEKIADLLEVYAN
jgi:UDP-N-acetylglucosamine--N-acetylmuramyl-(pentapeptide) pyrophosphoryl-undecaprenol N-acetylglucosamine transferase